MKKKIGRNDPCPCGSGKKYKRCCLQKKTNSASATPQGNHDGLRSAFAKYNQSDLIATLASLQLYPKNHTHAIRIEVAMRIACSLEKSGSEKIILKQLLEEINNHLPSGGPIGRMEDPPENLFTDNLVFHGGNYIVYPGIVQGERQILQALFNSIYQVPNVFPFRFKDAVKVASLGLFSISNEIAKRSGHYRYLDSPESWREPIEAPEENDFNIFLNSIQFTRGEIAELLEPFHLNYDDLRPFITETGDPKLKEGNPEKNPLFMKPLVESEGRLIVALPSLIMTALRHYIWVISDAFGIRDALSKTYGEVLRFNLQKWFGYMHFKNIEIQLPAMVNNLPIIEEVFKIDTDKLAYVQLVTDDATDYSKKDPFGSWISRDDKSQIDSRRDSAIKWLLDNESTPCRQVLAIIILGGIGRTMLYGANKEKPFTRMFLMTYEDLEVIAKIREYDELTLWKFAGAYNKILDSVEFITMSFLDTFAFYLDHHHSFYLGPERQPNFIGLTPGYGKKLTSKAAHIWDSHAALRGNPPVFITVCRRHEDGNIPIFIPEAFIARTPEQLVEGYAQPIWVDFKEDLHSYSAEIRRVCLMMVEMFTYWLWQLTPGLRPHLELLGPEPLHLFIQVEKLDSWENLIKSEGFQNQGTPIFSHQIQGRSIEITIPTAIQKQLIGPDNAGERTILEELMKVFDEMIAKSEKSPSLNHDERSKILNQYAPLGLKKKFYIIQGGSNAALYPNNLPRERLLQEHDIEEQLEGLVTALGSKAPPIGPIETRHSSTELCGAIVDVYLDRLRKGIKDFDWRSLLDQLIPLNEALLHHRAVTNLNIPTSIECYYSLQSKVNELVAELPKTTSTILAVKTLIEFIAAEPPRGNKIVIQDDLDSLLAISHHIANWGIISDHIHLETVNYKISILESGRVAVTGDDNSELWPTFVRQKTHEDVDSAIKDFKNHFEIEEASRESDDHILDKEVDSVFKAEFNLTLKQIVEFLDYLTQLGFDYGTQAPAISHSVLIRNIKEALNWSDTAIETAISLFSLCPREKWEKAPNGFEDKDTWPWRYNRRLSYLRKPIVVGPEPKEDPTILWGPRQVEEAGKYLVALITRGVYKANTEAMKALMGEIQMVVGKRFAKTARDWLTANTSLKVIPHEVKIGPGEQLTFNDDLGDIDILALDLLNDIIYSIECKNIFSARNPREIVNEIGYLIGFHGGSRKAWVQKHITRDQWIRSNSNDVVALFKVSSKPVKIRSLILTSEEIPAPYLREMELPFLSFSSLRREGVKILERLQYSG